MKETFIDKLGLEITDLLDKLIIPSEDMEKMLKYFFDIDFKGIEEEDILNYKYECKFWMLNEDLKTYSSVSFSNGECDEYDTIVTIDSNYQNGNIKNFNINTFKIEYFINLEKRFIPNREETQQNILISYLKHRLVDNGDFRMLGPKSFIHDKTDDKIVVYIRQDTFHIIHDGDCVIDNFSINNYGFSPLYITAEDLDTYYQDVIHHF